MRLVTAEQMRAIDRHAIDQIGLPAMVLMENAGRAVAEEVLQVMAELHLASRPWLILVGKGNNGGDGIVAARHLREAGIDVELLNAETPEQLRAEAALQRDIADRMAIPAAPYKPGQVAWKRYAGIVDGLLGTGTKGAPREPYASLIRDANASGLPIVAIDSPSGVDADTGHAHDPAIRAVRTVALAFGKCGLYQFPAVELAGEVVVRSIGIPAVLANQYDANTWLATKEAIQAELGLGLPLSRPNDGHKGTFGHVLAVAGSATYSGAGYLTAGGALRAGAGLVTWVLPEQVATAMTGRLPEAILAGVEGDANGNWTAHSAARLVTLAQDKEAVVVGPGIGRFKEDGDWLHQLWTAVTAPLLLDADALNILAENNGLAKWPKRIGPTVLTPHPGEMARLTGLGTGEVQRDRIGLARNFAVKHQIVLVLKGARTVTAHPDGRVFVNPTGNSGMATGGAGDVLAGVIAGLIAQGIPAETAAVTGVHIHGEAGDRAALRRPSPASLLASDLLDNL